MSGFFWLSERTMVLRARVERISRGAKLYQVASALGLEVQMGAKFERGLKDTPGGHPFVYGHFLAPTNNAAAPDYN